MESVLRRLMHETGLPAPGLQHPVHDGADGSVGRADLAWPAPSDDEIGGLVAIRR